MITPAQATHIMAYWIPVRHHAEFKEPIGYIEKCVTPAVIKAAGLTDVDLQAEAGGLWVGHDNYAGRGERVYTFDVTQTTKRANMSNLEFEQHKKSAMERVC